MSHPQEAILVAFKMNKETFTVNSKTGMLGVLGETTKSFFWAYIKSNFRLLGSLSYRGRL